MGAMDLHKVAVTMGKVIKLLSELQLIVSSGNDVYAHKEDFCVIAYMCRVGILDRIENNSYMLSPNLSIRIPTGLFSFKKETMYNALNLTVGKLEEIVSIDVVTKNYVEDILEHKGIFYEFERSLPANFKRKL